MLVTFQMILDTGYDLTSALPLNLILSLDVLDGVLIDLLTLDNA